MYLYLHSFIQRSVHERVKGEEKRTDRVQEIVAILTVSIEPEKKIHEKRHSLHYKTSSLKYLNA